VIKRRHVLISSAALLTSWALPTFAQTPASVEVTLVSYAVAKPVFARLIPEFQKEWKAKTGQTVTFKESYGASGAQTRAIIDGLEADILAQNLQSNITPLVEKKLVSADWNKRLPNSAIPATSVMVIVTRPGNPKQIRTWQDLTRSGVGIVLINPKTPEMLVGAFCQAMDRFLNLRVKITKAYLQGLVKRLWMLTSSPLPVRCWLQQLTAFLV